MVGCKGASVVVCGGGSGVGFGGGFSGVKPGVGFSADRVFHGVVAVRPRGNGGGLPV